MADQRLVGWVDENRGDACQRGQFLLEEINSSDLLHSMVAIINNVVCIPRLQKKYYFICVCMWGGWVLGIECGILSM